MTLDERGGGRKVRLTILTAIVAPLILLVGTILKPEIFIPLLRKEGDLEITFPPAAAEEPAQWPEERLRIEWRLRRRTFGGFEEDEDTRARIRLIPAGKSPFEPQVKTGPPAFFPVCSGTYTVEVTSLSTQEIETLSVVVKLPGEAGEPASEPAGGDA